MDAKAWIAVTGSAVAAGLIVYLLTRPSPGAAQAPYQPQQYQAAPPPAPRSQTTTAQDVAAIVGAVAGVLRSSSGGK